MYSKIGLCATVILCNVIIGCGDSESTSIDTDPTSECSCGSALQTSDTRMVSGVVMLNGVATHLPQNVAPGGQVDMQVEPPDGVTLTSTSVYISQDKATAPAESRKSIYVLRQRIGEPSEVVASATAEVDGSGPVELKTTLESVVDLASYRYAIVFLQEDGQNAAQSTLLGATYSFVY